MSEQRDGMTMEKIKNKAGFRHWIQVLSSFLIMDIQKIQQFTGPVIKLSQNDA